MLIRHIAITPEFEEKIWRKHGVSADEVLEVFAEGPRFRYVNSGYREGEDVYAAAGQSADGRYLIVFFILKKTRDVVVISARDMEDRERRIYERK